MNISRYLLRLCTFSLFATYSIRQNLQHYLRNVSSNRRATTIFVEQQHRLRNVTEHNHAAEASQVTVCEQLAR